MKIISSHRGFKFNFRFEHKINSIRLVGYTIVQQKSEYNFIITKVCVHNFIFVRILNLSAASSAECNSLFTWITTHAHKR